MADIDKLNIDSIIQRLLEGERRAGGRAAGGGQWGPGPVGAGPSRSTSDLGRAHSASVSGDPVFFITRCPCFHILIIWSSRTHHQCVLAGRRPRAMRTRLLYSPPPRKAIFPPALFPLNVRLHTDLARVTVSLSAHQIVVPRTGERYCVQRAPCRVGDVILQVLSRRNLKRPRWTKEGHS